MYESGIVQFMSAIRLKINIRFESIQCQRKKNQFFLIEKSLFIRQTESVYCVLSCAVFALIEFCFLFLSLLYGLLFVCYRSIKNDIDARRSCQNVFNNMEVMNFIPCIRIVQSFHLVWLLVVFIFDYHTLFYVLAFNLNL